MSARSDPQAVVRKFLKTISNGVRDGPAESATPNAKRPILARLLLMVRSRAAASRAEERMGALSEIYGLMMRYGTPSLFLTVSFDDVNHELILRFHRHMIRNGSLSSLQNPDFVPAPEDELLRVRRPLSEDEWATLYQQRSANTSATAGLAASIFNDLVHSLFEVAIGCPAGQAGQLFKTE
jgi:hypothetical protein